MSRKKKSTSFLTFDLLEDVMSISSPRREEIFDQASTFRIGPLVEYAYYEYANVINRLEPRSEHKAAQALIKALKLKSLARAYQDSSLHSQRVEFFKSPQEESEFEDGRWIAFCKRFEDAGIKAGLSKSFSQGLAGTFGEMTSNLFEHCEERSTGLVGYRVDEREFEYVVVDAGIGVLKSLQSCNEYDWLLDHGEALEIVVKDGESRFGRKGGRGTGFHDLLYNIADRNSYLRFRSGDHSYVLDGTCNPPLKKIYSCTHFQGFLISVICKAPRLSLTKS